MNKTVLITGASKGIGFATCQRLAGDGWKVIGISRHPAPEFPGIAVTCDLSSQKQTNEMLKKITTAHRIDAVINNVGISLPESLSKISLDHLHQVYNLNVRTAVQITQKCVEHMKNQSWGRIVNISSRAIFGVKDRTSYAAAKSALIGCTKTWALELAEYNICVNAIAPGPVETELFRKAHPKDSSIEKRTLASIPLKRVGQPNEIAAAVEFLLSEDAGFITGQLLCIDGGGSL